MTQEQNKQIIYFIVVGILLAVIFFYFSRRVLTPFFIAFALAYILDPVTDRLELLKISRTFAVLFLMVGVFSLVTGVGLLIFPLLKLQAEHFVSNCPNYISIIQQWIYPLSNARIPRYIHYWPQRSMAISIPATERLGAYPLLAGGREKVAKSIIHYLKTGEIQYPFIRIRPPKRL